MQSAEVYSSTTVTDGRQDKTFSVPSKHLSLPRFAVKVAEVLLSFLAFVLEEVVTSCMRCAELYFFEFISCTAFLFTLLLLILLATKLHSRVGINCWPKLDFGYTGVIGALFLCASIAFAVVNGGTAVEHAAVIFGFLASLAFLADLLLFWKELGNPCRPTDPEANGDPAARGPEGEGLTTPTN